MTKISNQYSLTNILTADLANSRLGINNVSPTVALDVTGAGKFSGVLTLGSTISNGTYAYTLPSATGTLALTSALSSYLPLTGGTLTGALSGTSATFSGEVSVTSGLFSISGSGATPPTGGVGLRFVSNRLIIYGGTSDITFQKNSNSGPNLTILESGAATFSSSVTADGLFRSNQGIFQVYGVGTFRGGLYNYAQSSGSGTDYTPTLLSETDLYFTTGGSSTKKVVITSAGNVGIGTSSPTSAGGGYIGLDIRGSGGGSIQLGSTAQAYGIMYAANGGFYIQSIASQPIIFYTSAEAMRILSGGSVLFGTTTATGITTGTSVNVGISFGGGVTASQVNSNANNYWSKASGYTSGDFTAHFVNSAYVGGISTNGSTTNYAVASDYRLKEDLKDFVGIDLINRIKTYDYQWKSDKTRMYGVVAHEFAEVLSYAVTGQKDEERMQGVDYSKIVPVLVKAIQELSAENTSLINRIEALENK